MVQPSRKNTLTLLVNAHGGLILLKEAVQSGATVSIRNLKTEEEILCTVVDVNAGANGTAEIGVEFVQPNSKFWRVSFPPSDWSPRSPEAKRFAGGSKPAAAVAKSPEARPTAAKPVGTPLSIPPTGKE